MSSNLASVGYDASRKILEIEFKSGSVYRYSPTSESIYRNLMAAPSNGRYFHAAIRNRIPYKRVM